MLKQILSLPDTVTDPAIYILFGSIPVEGMIHSRVLNLFGSVCRLSEESVKKQVATARSGGRQVKQLVYWHQGHPSEIRPANDMTSVRYSRLRSIDRRIRIRTSTSILVRCIKI